MKLKSILVLLIIILLSFCSCDDEQVDASSEYTMAEIQYTLPASYEEAEREDDYAAYHGSTDDNSYIGMDIRVLKVTNDDKEYLEKLKDSAVNLSTIKNRELIEVAGSKGVKFQDKDDAFHVFFILGNYEYKMSCLRLEESEELLDAVVSSVKYIGEDESGSSEADAAGTVGQQNALETAEDYIASAGYSEQNLREQLAFEGYEKAEIDWAIEHMSVDWTKECVQAAKEYMDSSSFSAESLKEQLAFEGFTNEQIEAGLIAVGY